MLPPIEIDEELAGDIHVPAHLSVYVDILGIAQAVEFLLHFGGSELHVSETPKGGSELERLFGTSIACEFGRHVQLMQRRVPLGSRWIAQVMRVSGASVASIARRLHKTDLAVRRMLR